MYAVDNSEHPEPALVERLSAFPRVEYVSNQGNQGIARALNRGAELAIAAGFDYLLTMDQDSTATPGMVETLCSCLDAFGRDSVGIVSPRHQLGDESVPESGEFSELEATMTSGNLLNLAAYRVAGPFRDDYFIDYVDHEYCLRLRQHGYRVIMANKAVLRHRLGDMTWHRLLGKTIKVGNHPPLRRYYSYRNRFLLHKQYGAAFPVYFKYFYREIAQEVVAVFLYERNKAAKLRMMLRGYLDYRRDIAGKFTENGR